eukprot:c9572_g1_i1.p1 GENE.c9572_g1_i1~~c9572_g1_i1.p1  ORF type:complete len:105 (+),score=11.15 c9572_g1_i1:99-413(+)
MNNRKLLPPLSDIFDPNQSFFEGWSPECFIPFELSRYKISSPFLQDELFQSDSPLNTRKKSLHIPLEKKRSRKQSSSLAQHNLSLKLNFIQNPVSPPPSDKKAY